MQFNSLEFALFFPVVFTLYWLAAKKGARVQNALLLAAGYVFYGWWDWRFLLVLISLSLANFFIALRLQNSPRGKNIWLIAGLVANVGVLAVFKYAGFFIDGFRRLASLVGYDPPATSLNIILPVGMSFYVFISISYLLDVRRGACSARTNAVEVQLALGFFPVVLAGPIQRPSSLLPQIAAVRDFRYDLAADGARQVLWGLFAKAAVADHLARTIDDVFANASSYPGSTLAAGALFLAVQIYADFSGYSNIAIGVGKLLGFEITRNFSYPYFSRTIKDFWRKWHMSLMSWFRDYVFLPLSYSISRKLRSERTLLIRSDLLIYASASLVTWLLTGLWHGARAAFIVWGLLNGVLLVAHHLQVKPRKALFRRLGIGNGSRIVAATDTLITLLVLTVLWVVFRAGSLGQALAYLGGMFSKSLFSPPEFESVSMAVLGVVLTAVFLFVEWLGRSREHGLAGLGMSWKRPLRWALYDAVILATFFFAGAQKPFIYFRF